MVLCARRGKVPFEASAQPQLSTGGFGLELLHRDHFGPSLCSARNPPWPQHKQCWPSLLMRSHAAVLCARRGRGPLEARAQPQLSTGGFGLELLLTAILDITPMLRPQSSMASAQAVLAIPPHEEPCHGPLRAQSQGAF